MNQSNSDEVNSGEVHYQNKLKMGAVIMLAWPETRVLGTGAWYDKISNRIGLAKNNTYKVGHAAFCLVDYDLNQALYYDFGRYQSPLGFGRIRDLHTDPELQIHVSPYVVKGKLVNLEQILKDIKNNNSCHGDGYLISTIQHNIPIDGVYNYIKALQENAHIRYAPFMWASTNCSRFASGAFIATQQEGILTQLMNKLTLFHFNLPIKQITAKSKNKYVHVVDDSNVYRKLTVSEFKTVKPSLHKSYIPSTTIVPDHFNDGYHQLKGIGAHAFYKIHKNTDKTFTVSRYDDHNDMHFQYDYEVTKGHLDFDAPFKLTYPSHAKRITILQDGEEVILSRLSV